MPLTLTKDYVIISIYSSIIPQRGGRGVTIFLVLFCLSMSFHYF